jgi:hypothetical protein
MLTQQVTVKWTKLALSFQASDIVAYGNRNEDQRRRDFVVNMQLRTAPNSP